MGSQGRGWGREEAIQSVMEFVREHPESYASVAICRRALQPGLEAVRPETLERLQAHLEQAPDEELEAYYYIVT